MNEWLPPALAFRPKSQIRATSTLRAILDAEQFWPSEILEEPYVYLDTTSGPLLFLCTPELVKEALTRRDGTLPRSRLQQRFAGHGTGRENVITETSSRGQVHRRSLAPFFRPKAIAQDFPFIQQTICHALQPILSIQQSDTLDISRFCVHATLSVIWQFMFGTKGQLTPPAMVTQLADSLHAAGLSGDLKQTAQAVHHAREISMAMRPQTPLVGGCPFARTPPADLALTDQEVHDNAQFLLTAGHESTALTITWAFYLLSRCPQQQDAIAEEISQVLNGQPITMAALQQMKQLNRLFNETMRLYPAGPVINREAVQDIQLNDLTVKQGTQVAICFYAMHRHHHYWNDPDAFRPERFGTGDKLLRHEAFMPFSGGHHSCLGDHLAWLEASLVLAHVLQHYRVEPVNEIKPVARYTLRPNDRLMVRLTRR